MGLAAAVTASLCVWIVFWALGAKSFDAFMIAIVIMVLAATVKLLTPHLPGRRRG
ncbi:MAG: hypothetical protein ACXVP1_09560 [Thermoleophilia bacterium]